MGSLREVYLIRWSIVVAAFIAVISEPVEGIVNIDSHRHAWDSSETNGGSGIVTLARKVWVATPRHNSWQPASIDDRSIDSRQYPRLTEEGEKNYVDSEIEKDPITAKLTNVQEKTETFQVPRVSTVAKSSSKVKLVSVGSMAVAHQVENLSGEENLSPPLTCPPDCSKNGHCDGGVCVCGMGRKGEACEQFDCSAVNECSGHGLCTEWNKCTCKDPFAGANCSRDSRCDDECSGHGHCLEGSAECACRQGWHGERCNLKPHAVQYRRWERLFPAPGWRYLKGDYDGDGSTYRGEARHAGAGLEEQTCMHWDAALASGGAFIVADAADPAAPTTAELASAGIGHHALCRNPDKSDEGPWCFVSDATSPVAATISVASSPQRKRCSQLTRSTFQGSRRSQVGQRPDARFGHAMSPLPSDPATGLVPGFVVHGGVASQRVSGDMWVFDVGEKTGDTNVYSWRREGQFSSGPLGRAFHSLTPFSLAGSAVFLLYGGIGADVPTPIPLDDLWQFTLSTGEWSSLPSRPATDIDTGAVIGTPGGRAEHTAVTCIPRGEDGSDTSNSAIVLFGGYSRTADQAANVDAPSLYVCDRHAWLLDPRALVWTRGSAFPGPGRRGHSAVTSMDQSAMWVFGGFNEFGGTADNAVVAYEPGADAWIVVKAPTYSQVSGVGPIPRAHHAAIGREGVMLIMGGIGDSAGSTVLDDVWAWSSSSTQWTQLESSAHKPSARAFGQACLIGAEKIALFAGSVPGEGNLAMADIWTLEMPSSKWTRPFINGAQPRPRLLQSTVIIDHQLLLFGGEALEANGRSHREKLRDLWTFDVGGLEVRGQLEWREITPAWLAVDELVAGSDTNIDGIEVGQQSVSMEGQSVDDDDVDSTDKGAIDKSVLDRYPIITTVHGCTCKHFSVDADTGDTHIGCGRVPGDIDAWCDTQEACRFGEFWDYCRMEATPTPQSDVARKMKSKQTFAVDGISSSRGNEAHTSAMPDVHHHQNLGQASLVQVKADLHIVAPSGRGLGHPVQAWPAARGGHAVAAANFRGIGAGACGRKGRAVMLLFGGEGDSEDAGVEVLYNDLLAYCPASRQWSNIGSPGHLPSPRSSAAIVASGTDAFIYGGMIAGRVRTNDLWRCTLETGACVEIATSGWTPQRRRGMMLAVESRRSCPAGCEPQGSPRHLLMFNGYWTETHGQRNLTGVIQHRCISLKPPFVDAYCDRTCHVDPEGTDCLSRCRCKRDHPMDVWRLSLDTHEWDIVHTTSGPPTRFAAQSVAFEGRIWMFGGFVGGDVVDGEIGGEFGDFWTFDPDALLWKFHQAEPGAMRPQARHSGNLGIVRSFRGAPHVILSGGIGVDGVLNDVWAAPIQDIRYE